MHSLGSSEEQAYWQKKKISAGVWLMHLPNTLQAYSSALLRSAKSTLLCATVHRSNQNGVLHCAIHLLSWLLDQQVISGYLCEYMSQLKRIHTLSLAERVLRSDHAFEIPFFFRLRVAKSWTDTNLLPFCIPPTFIVQRQCPVHSTNCCRDT